MNGKHEVRLERIEARIEELHEKVDALVEGEAENRTDIVWLTWMVRLLIGAVLGVGGLTLPQFL